MFNLKKQIRLLYITGILGNLSITGAWVVIMASRGFSLVQIGFAETIFHITSLICEIPTGMLADVYGRKKMLAISNIMAITGDLITAISGNFTVACMAMPFHAMAYNFASGSGDALAYDSMKKVGKEGGFEKYNANQFIIYRVAGGISTLCAGLALYLGYRKAYLISAVMGLVTLFFTLKLVEISVDESKEVGGAEGVDEVGGANVILDAKKVVGVIESRGIKEDSSFTAAGGATEANEKHKTEIMTTKLSHSMMKKLFAYFKESIGFLRHNPKAAKLMFLNSFVGAVAILLLFFLQTKLKTAGISNLFLGLALFIMQLGGVVGSKLITHFRKLRYPFLFIICTIGVLIGVLLEHSGLVPVMVIGGFLASLCDDAIEIRTNTKLQDMFPSEQRATLISISSFTFSVIMILLSPLAGYVFSIW